MTNTTMQIDKKEIANLGLSSIKSYFLVDSSTITDEKVLLHLLQKAKLGMQFEREMNISNRATEVMSFKIMKITAESKAELKAYLKKKLSHYT